MAIIRHEDALSRLPQNLLNIFVQREQMNLAKEDQKIREKDFKLREQEQAAARAQEAEAMRLRQMEILGASVAAQAIGQRDPSLAPILQQLPPEALPFFLQNAQSFGLGAAQVQSAGAKADVDTATVDDIIRRTRGEADLVGAQVEGVEAQTELSREQLEFNRLTQIARVNQEFAEANGMSIQNALGQIRLGLAQQGKDPDIVTAAHRVLAEGGLPWGQIADSYGIPTGSIPADFQYPIQVTSGGAGGEAAAKAASLYTIMQASNETINRLVKEGTELGLQSSWHRSSANWLTSWISGVGLTDDVRSVVQAQKQFADAYRFFISGQQSSDKEAERLLFTMLENPGEKEGDAVVNQKRFMRRLVIGMAADIAGGRLNSLDAANKILNTAVEMGLPQEQIDIFREQRNDAAQYMLEGGPFGSIVPSSTGGNVGRVDGLIDSVIGGS